MLIWLTSEQWIAWRITTWWKRTYEGLRGARFVSPCLTLFCEFFWSCVWVGVVLVGVCVWFLLFLFVVAFFQGNFCIQLGFFWLSSG